MEHTADNIDCVVGGLEFLVYLDGSAVTVLHLYIVPRVYIYLLNACAEDVFREEGEFRHFRIQSVDKLRLRHILNGNSVIKEILSYIPLYLIFHLIVACVDIVDAIYNEGGILA